MHLVFYVELLAHKKAEKPEAKVTTACAKAEICSP